MGFSLYWKWRKLLPDAENFAAWSCDVEHLLTYLTAPEYCNTIPAMFSFQRTFTVKKKEDGSLSIVDIDPAPCEENGLVICGPDGIGEPIFTVTQVAFNRDASTRENCQGFSLSLEDLRQAPFWHACKTGPSPYAVLVLCALARFIHYFPDAAIFNDEGEEPITKAVALCCRAFGENRSPQPWFQD